MYNIRIAVRSQHPEFEISYRVAICWKGGREGQGLRKTVRRQDLAAVASSSPFFSRSFALKESQDHSPKTNPVYNMKPERFRRSLIKCDALPRVRVLPHEFKACPERIPIETGNIQAY